MRPAGCIILALISLLASTPADADIYKCRRPDGSVELSRLPCQGAARPAVPSSRRAEGGQWHDRRASPGASSLTNNPLDRMRHRSRAERRSALMHELEYLEDQREWLLAERQREVARAQRAMRYGPVDPVGTVDQRIAPAVNEVATQYQRLLDENEQRMEEIRQDLRDLR